MSGILIRNFFLTLYIILLSMCKESDSLANTAVYTIQNEGTKQCLSAGPVEKTEYTKPGVLKHGSALMKPCSNTSSLETTDFGQQWTIRITKKESGKGIYQVQLVMLNAQFEDPVLHAKLRGEFISYFPKFISLKEPYNRRNSQLEEFYIIDPATEHCLTNRNETKIARFSNCWKNSSQDVDREMEKFQLWSFALVNEIQPMREHRKLKKNLAAYLWSDSSYKQVGNVSRILL